MHTVMQHVQMQSDSLTGLALLLHIAWHCLAVPVQYLSLFSTCPCSVPVTVQYLSLFSQEGQDSREGKKDLQKWRERGGERAR